MSEEVKKRVSQRRSIISGRTENKNFVGWAPRPGWWGKPVQADSLSLPILGYTHTGSVM